LCCCAVYSWLVFSSARCAVAAVCGSLFNRHKQEDPHISQPSNRPVSCSSLTHLVNRGIAVFAVSSILLAVAGRCSVFGARQVAFAHVIQTRDGPHRFRLADHRWRRRCCLGSVHLQRTTATILSVGGLRCACRSTRVVLRLLFSILPHLHATALLYLSSSQLLCSLPRSNSEKGYVTASQPEDSPTEHAQQAASTPPPGSTSTPPSAITNDPQPPDAVAERRT
jgi:hypothetical protein